MTFDGIIIEDLKDQLIEARGRNAELDMVLTFLLHMTDPEKPQFEDYDSLARNVRACIHATINK